MSQTKDSNAKLQPSFLDILQAVLWPRHVNILVHWA